MAILDRFLTPESTFQQRFFFLAKRFVAGETATEAMDAIRSLNDAGMTGTLDFLGEDVTSRDEALRTRDAYVELLDRIERDGVKTNVSVKLTACGLLVSEDFAYENLSAIVERAARNADPFVRIDMEGSALAEATLRVFARVYAEHKNVGPVLQAYLRRTPSDVAAAIAQGARIRLCKGAYKEPPTVAHQEMPIVRREYMRLAESLLTDGVYPGIATHDERIIAAIRTFAAERGIGKERFEFQLLYGVRTDLQKALVAEGYNVRVYVPYGTHWAGYFYRRISERKENAFLALRALVQK